MRKGQSQMVSFVLLFAIGAIIAVAFYYMYAGSGADVGASLEAQRTASLNRMKSSVTFFAPQSMKNGSSYYGAVYNSGVVSLHSPVLSFSRSGTESELSLTDVSGTNITYLPAGDVGFFSVSERPMEGNLLLFHSDEMNHFHVFPDDVSRVVLLQSSKSSLNSIDEVYENITTENCTSNTTYSWYVGMPKSDVHYMFMDTYARSTLGATYTELNDLSTEYVTDSFGTAWTRATYDISDFNYSDDTLEVCVRVTKGRDLELDYLRAVVLY